MKRIMGVRYLIGQEGESSLDGGLIEKERLIEKIRYRKATIFPALFCFLVLSSGKPLKRLKPDAAKFP